MSALPVALIGCGYMGGLHARCVAIHPGARLVSCTDILPERSEVLCARWGGRALPDVAPEARAVILATPTSTHAALVSRYLARGLWVLAEKPLAPFAVDCVDHPRLIVGHSERFHPGLRSLEVEGLVELTACRMSPPTGRCADSDVVLDLMLHDVDLLLWWCGEAQVLEVAVAETRAGLLERVVAYLALPGGGRARLEASRIASCRERRLQLHDVGGVRTIDLLAPVPEGTKDALTAQLDAWLDRIDSGTTFPGAMARDARGAIRLVEQIRRMGMETG